MTWTIQAMGGPTLTTVLATAVMPDPAHGDVSSHTRRQVSARSDGKTVHIQDLGAEDEFFEATWTQLPADKRSELLQVSRAANWQIGPLTISVSVIPCDQGVMSVPIQTGMLDVNGRPFTTGSGFTTGQLVAASQWSWGGVHVETDELAFEQNFKLHGSVALRLRINTSTGAIVGSP